MQPFARPTSRASLEVVSRASYLRTDPRRIGFAASSPLRAVSIPECADFFRSVFPRCLTTSSSSRSCHSSSEFLRLVSSLGSPFGPSFTSPRFVPSSRLHPRAATFSRKVPTSRFVPSSDFLSPSTVCSALGLAGLFHPAATSRVSLVQGLLSPCSLPRSSRGACPLAVGSQTAHPLAQAAAIHAPRLRGFHPHRAACSPAHVIHMSRRRSPPRVSLPQAPTSRDPHPLTGCFPLAMFARPTFAFALAARAHPQRVSRLKPDSAVSGLPACSSFRAFRPISPAPRNLRRRSVPRATTSSRAPRKTAARLPA